MHNPEIDVGYVVSWLKMTQHQVLKKFSEVENAYMDGVGDSCFIYIPGTRPDKVLLAAHADTVFGEWHKPKIGLENGVLFSLSNKDTGIIRSRNSANGRTASGTGIGADDRAGCAIVWKLINSGHSILITSGEEIGQIAANKIMENDWWKKEIKSHQFAVQFDRRGYNDIVFYNCGTDEFENYVQKETGYKVRPGSRTDICVLCKDICGVNISVGYYNEHTSDEILILNQWFNTYLTTKKWLNKPDLPKFSLETIKKPTSLPPCKINHNRPTNPVPYQNRLKTKYEIEKALKENKDYSLFCESCGNPSKAKAFSNNNWNCPICKMPLFSGW